MTRVWKQRKREIRPADLRAEGVVEIGAAPETSLLYVRTMGRLCLFHVDYLRDRALDSYAIELAVNWIESGLTGAQVAGNLGVSELTLKNALALAGYERIARTARDTTGRKDHRIGNRRGGLLRLRSAGSSS